MDRGRYAVVEHIEQSFDQRHAHGRKGAAEDVGAQQEFGARHLGGKKIAESSAVDVRQRLVPLDMLVWRHRHVLQCAQACVDAVYGRRSLFKPLVYLSAALLAARAGFV
ncbi:hypothetical protein SDC9_168996 [bioreactor metagenome]|uniref:Uncharacterized protein n=1 Tax=bioreactor metagenome TaxID=1076179 RepID=A0A645G660_9ZZZZ